MKHLKESKKSKPKVTLVLLDWSVRESFHLLGYLQKQTVDSEQFEVMFIEYYSKVSDRLKAYADMVDSWMLLEMPDSYYYHKHLMYNVGILNAKGDIVVVCDSDMMVKPNFIESIIKTFEENDNVFLHIDQFRSAAKEYYPFSYPSFEDVTSNQCKNNRNGVTTGLAATVDTIHLRNYGACFCALRKDLIDIGGADEHIDYVGHICGPYDMSFRLIIAGKKELWHEETFVYHTWHPGSDGAANYLGPHDGKHMSSTALMAFSTKQTQPHVKNKAIEHRQRKEADPDSFDEKDLFNPEFSTILDHNFLLKGPTKEIAKNTYQSFTHEGIVIKRRVGSGFEAFSKTGRALFKFKSPNQLPSKKKARLKREHFIELAFFYFKTKQKLRTAINLPGRFLPFIKRLAAQTKIRIRQTPRRKLPRMIIKSILRKLANTQAYLKRKKERAIYLKQRQKELKGAIKSMDISSIGEASKILFCHQSKLIIKLFLHKLMKNNETCHTQQILSINDFHNKDKFDHIIIDENLFQHYFEILKDDMANHRITII